MGSPHAAIYVDGVRVGNIQSGQADLGIFDLGNCGNVVLDYAQNSISFNTAKPVFGNRIIGGKVMLRGGSFGTYEPSARLNFRLSDKTSLSATAGGVLSKGDFPLADSFWSDPQEYTCPKCGAKYSVTFVALPSRDLGYGRPDWTRFAFATGDWTVTDESGQNVSHYEALAGDCMYFICTCGEKSKVFTKDDFRH